MLIFIAMVNGADVSTTTLSAAGCDPSTRIAIDTYYGLVNYIRIYKIFLKRFMKLEI
jgi:hypothetical protein